MLESVPSPFPPRNDLLSLERTSTMKGSQRTIFGLSLLAICGIVAFSCCSFARATDKEQILRQAAATCSSNELQWVEELYSRNPMHRGNALQRLGSYPNAARLALPRVGELLSDGSIWNPFCMASVGEEAAGLLDHIGGETAFDIAVSASTNRSATARRNAVWAFPLERNGRATANAVPVLKALLSDKDRVVRNRAAKSLSGLDMSKFGDSPEAWLHWYENSAWHSPSRQDYAYFAVYEQDRRLGPQVYAPLDAARLSAYTNRYYHVVWTGGKLGRIQSIERIENGKVVWIRTFASDQSLPERDQLY